jgi:uncharacterized protein YyaL (SSP411 family)
MNRSIVTAFVVVMTTTTAIAANSSSENRQASHCAALSNAVAAQLSGSNATFVRSYDHGQDESQLPAGLASSAFVYDNAVAAIALTACGNVASATVIGKALSLAVRKDRSFNDGRVRNAYRAGPVSETAPALPGWRDSKQNLWAEDPAQDGTSTGNVAWAALALLTLHQATKQEALLEDAKRLINWVIANVASGSGFRGGFHGYDPQQVRLTWMSTEHNVDVYAAATWLLRLTGEQKYADAAAQARQFVERTFDADHFLLGTKPDGSLMDSGMLALDVQLWPWMAIADAPAQWRSALNFAASHMAVEGGFDFNGDRDGLWVEGTAQASMAYPITGDPIRSKQLLTTLEVARTPSGLLNATLRERISTGLSIDPTSTEADFFYFRRPHLGATAWATLAATGWNPFTGKKVD